MHFFFTGPRILGIRPGVVFGAEDLRPRRSLESPIEGCFVYVIRAQEELVKVGVTTDPRARIAALQTGSAHPLSFAAILATPGSGYDIEAATHLILRPYRMEGEWFDIPPSVAVAAITVAARRLAQPLLSVSLDDADKILAVARNAPQGSLGQPGRTLVKIAKIGAGALLGIIFAILVSAFLIP